MYKFAIIVTVAIEAQLICRVSAAMVKPTCGIRGGKKAKGAACASLRRADGSCSNPRCRNYRPASRGPGMQG